MAQICPKEGDLAHQPLEHLLRASEVRGRGRGVKAPYPVGLTTPRTSAADNLAERLDKVDLSVCGRYNERNVENPIRPRLVVRGHKMEMKLTEFCGAVSAGQSGAVLLWFSERRDRYKDSVQSGVSAPCIPVWMPNYVIVRPYLIGFLSSISSARLRPSASVTPN